MDEELAQAFGALAHPQRIAILRLLGKAGQGGLQFGSIVHAVQLPTTTASSHMAVLKKGGFVIGHGGDRRGLYRLNPGFLDALGANLSHISIGTG